MIVLEELVRRVLKLPLSACKPDDFEAVFALPNGFVLLKSSPVCTFVTFSPRGFGAWRYLGKVGGDLHSHLVDVFIRRSLPPPDAGLIADLADGITIGEEMLPKYERLGVPVRFLETADDLP